MKTLIFSILAVIYLAGCSSKEDYENVLQQQQKNTLNELVKTNHWFLNPMQGRDTANEMCSVSSTRIAGQDLGTIQQVLILRAKAKLQDEIQSVGKSVVTTNGKNTYVSSYNVQDYNLYLKDIEIVNYEVLSNNEIAIRVCAPKYDSTNKEVQKNMNEALKKEILKN
jgi:hypothetical protein